MITIKTMEDIHNLKARKQLSDGFLQHLNKYFRELHHSLEHETPLENFTLEYHGYIVILELEKDDCHDLSDVGLSNEENGLLGITPEFVNIIKAGTNEEYFQIFVLYDNEFGMVFYYPNSNKGDAEIIEFLMDFVS